jgi:uracil-DNA glycosylase family 4
MSLDLDDRQRAMLLEMGVHVWWPRADAPPAPVSRAPTPAHAPRAAAPAVAPTPIERLAVHAVSVRGGVSRQEPARPAVAWEARVNANANTTAGEVAGMDWAGLSQAVASCQACKLCAGRRAPVFEAMPEGMRADWLVVGEPPEDADERAGRPYADQVGQLLDNMLKAVGVMRQNASQPVPAAQAAYLTPVVKCRPALPAAPQPHDLAACEPYLKRELALVQPKVILALGRMAAQTLLRESDPHASSMPLGKLRGQIYQYQGIPVVVSYPPSYLLRNPQEKARAWADLCLALSVARPVQE